MIIIEHGNEVLITSGLYIDYGLVQMKINNIDIVPLPCDPRDMYDVE